jgi:hypothetical protein
LLLAIFSAKVMLTKEPFAVFAAFERQLIWASHDNSELTFSLSYFLKNGVVFVISGFLFPWHEICYMGLSMITSAVINITVIIRSEMLIHRSYFLVSWALQLAPPRLNQAVCSSASVYSSNEADDFRLKYVHL